MTTRSPFAQDESDLNDRPGGVKPRRRSPVKADMTDDSQWVSRRDRLLQDYKAFALADLQAADAKRNRKKAESPVPLKSVQPQKQPSPPRNPSFPWSQPPPRKIIDYDAGVQTQPLPKVDHSAECLLERYPPDDLQYAKLIGNWEHTNPYIWADMLFHRKRMEMERELAETRIRKMQEEVTTQQSRFPTKEPVNEKQTAMKTTYPPPVPTPPQASSTHSSQGLAEEPPEGYTRYRVPGHFEIKADISKMEYDFANKAREMEEILGSLKLRAEDSAKEHREALKEFEMLKEDLRLKSLEMDIKTRSLQSVLDEPYYSTPSPDFGIDLDHFVSQGLPSLEPELLSSESVFLHSRPQDYQSDEYEGMYDSRQKMVERFVYPYQLSVRRVQDVVIEGEREELEDRLGEEEVGDTGPERQIESNVETEQVEMKAEESHMVGEPSNPPPVLEGESLV